MKRIMIYSKYRKRKNIQLQDLKNKIIANSSFILMFTLFSCGLILSTAILFSSDVGTSFKISGFITKYIFSSKNYLYSAILLLIISAIQILLSVIFASSCFGASILCILPLFTGFFSGSIAGHLMNMYGTNGMIYYLISLCPSYIVLNTIMLNLFNRSQHLSYLVRHTVFGNNIEHRISEQFKSYLLFSIITLIIVAFSVLMQFLLTNISDNLLT